MAAISTFSPPIDDKRWVSQGSKTIASELIIEIDLTPSIFQVPKALSETNPKAYTPQLLGLGPYHHLRPELCTMDRQKLAVINKILTQKSSKNFSQSFIDKMRNLEPVVRANYDVYLDLEGSTLEYIITIDSLYLLEFLGMYEQNTEAENLDPGYRELAKDVVMLENQIPAFALVEMGKELGLFSPVRGTQETMLYSQLFYHFCKVHSPLKLTEKRGKQCMESKHLLAHMYHLIVEHGFSDRMPVRSNIVSQSTGKEIECLTILRELGLGGAMINPLPLTLKSLQVLEKSKLADELSKDKEEKPEIEKIEIPTASELCEKHKVDFRLHKYGGIRSIRFVTFVPEGIRVLILPEITMRCDSEVVLRNLVAYEAAVKSTFELAEYVDLMCGIVYTPKDVALLREKGIVKGDLNDEEVAEIFNRMSKSVGKSKEESESMKVVKQVKEMVEKWENQKVWKRQYRFLEKNVKIVIEFMRNPSGGAVKYVMSMFMLLMLILQIMQAFCQFYGCNFKIPKPTDQINDVH